MRLINADRLTRPEILGKYYHLPNGDTAIPIIDIKNAPTVDAVPLDKLCELLAEMYHCPSSGWPSSGCACHPGCPDEAFEKLCGTDCDKHTDVERWKAFLTNWMEGLDEADKRLQTLRTMKTKVK